MSFVLHLLISSFLQGGKYKIEKVLGQGGFGITYLAERITDGKRVVIKENMPAALKALKELGVSTWAVIHCPEIGIGLDENDNLVEVPSLKLPAGWIAGMVL